MVHPDAQFGPVQERIQAALAKGRELVAATTVEFADCGDKVQPDWEKVAGLGPMAVELAGAMWEDFVRSPEYNGAYTSPPAALVAFAEKVEGL